MGILKNSFENLSYEDEKTLQEYFHGYDYRGAGYTLLANYKIYFLLMLHVQIGRAHV